MYSVKNGSVMNVVFCNLVCYEHGLLWTGLFRKKTQRNTRNNIHSNFL